MFDILKEILKGNRCNLPAGKRNLIYGMISHSRKGWKMNLSNKVASIKCF